MANNKNIWPLYIVVWSCLSSSISSFYRMIGAPRWPLKLWSWRFRVAPPAIHGPRRNGTLLTNDGLCIVEDGARGSATASIRCGCATGPFLPLETLSQVHFHLCFAEVLAKIVLVLGLRFAQLRRSLQRKRDF